MIFVVSGPSGCGKSTLIGRVLDRHPEIRFSISHTTRPKRAGEKEGREYHFIARREFEELVARDGFVEWAVVHGRLYGTSRREVESKGLAGDLVLDVDVQGARSIRARFKEAAFIFVLPPLFADLKKRLQARGLDSAEEVEQRLENARREIRHWEEFDYVVVNDDFETAALDLESVILGQRCRREARKKAIEPILRSFLRKAGR